MNKNLQTPTDYLGHLNEINEAYGAMRSIAQAYFGFPSANIIDPDPAADKPNLIAHINLLISKTNDFLTFVNANSLKKENKI